MFLWAFECGAFSAPQLNDPECCIFTFLFLFFILQFTLFPRFRAISCHFLFLELFMSEALFFLLSNLVLDYVFCLERR